MHSVYSQLYIHLCVEATSQGDYLKGYQLHLQLLVCLVMHQACWQNLRQLTCHGAVGQASAIRHLYAAVGHLSPAQHLQTMPMK